MAERLLGVECGAQFPAESARNTTIGKIAKNERKNTIWPAGTSPAALMQVDMPTKIATETTFSPIPTSGLEAGWCVGLNCFPPHWIADQMRAGVAGISMWPMP